MEIENKDISLGPENVLLRGSMLRNTKAVIGIVIFTGHETKVMLNAAQASPKWSNLESKTNLAILIVLGFQLFISIIAAIIGANWAYANSEYVDEISECNPT